jgi:spore photoproduct lyase
MEKTVSKPVTNFAIDELWIDERSVPDRITQRIRSRLPHVPARFLPESEITRFVSGLDLNRGKRILLLERHPGDPVKPCPATRHPCLCCRYTIINQAFLCPMDCSYCILQTYLNRPVLTVFTNVEDVFAAVDRKLAEEPDRLFRLGTGELSDSLALDNLTGLSGDYAAFFRGKSNAILEWKTKTDFVDNLLLEDPFHTVVSWSLNPPSVVEEEEWGSAPIRRRLEAARRCQDHGYLAGFHFDPLVIFDGWEKEYVRLVDDLVRTIDPSRIAWISLGTLRYPPALKAVVRRRFPKSRIVSGEMVRGLDGKMRYPRPVRENIYRIVLERIREKMPDVFVYFCMESPDVWEHVIGWCPKSNADLDYGFALHLWKQFPALHLDQPHRQWYQD